MTRTTQQTNLQLTYSATQIDTAEPPTQAQPPHIDPVLLIVAIALLIKTTLLSTAVLFRVVLLKQS
jgi:hypothetical protein